MKSYTITVNGTAYEVTVEETGSVSAPTAAPVAAPKAAPAAAPKAPPSAYRRRCPCCIPDIMSSFFHTLHLIDPAGQEARAEAVVDIHHAGSAGAGVQHGQQGGDAA